MRIFIALSALLVVGSAAFAADTVDLHKMTGWAIVAPDNAIPSEQYAAQEFQALLKQATGIELPIATKPPKKKHNVFIGAGAAMKASRVGFEVSNLGEEGLRIRVKKANIAIAGGQPRGTLYGVYEFFQRYAGVRFLTYDDTYFPEAASLQPVPCEDYSYVPPFSFRWSFYRENVEQPAFSVRLRVNTVANDDRLGGVTQQNLISHSLYKWVTPEKYGKTHPEYFALVDGERKLDVGGGGPEVCVTNPEVIDIVAQGVIAELDANPKLKNISVSQNDNDAYCRCPRCEEINKREGTPMGSHLAFVNAVAERVEKKYPDVKVGTLAYWYTRQAPKTIVPRKNVQIQLCSIECCTFHAIDDPACERNKKFCNDMMAWKAICNDIWVWNYNTDFSCYDMPFPNLRSIGANVRFFLNNNVKGVFMQANGNGSSGEMSDLRNYVIANCIWHPGQDSWPLVEEFCRFHYKKAAPPILDYLAMLHDNVAASKLHPGCFPSAEDVGLKPEIARKAFAYFENALARADDDAIRARVEKASIPAYKAMILAGGGAWQYADGAVRRDWPEQYRGVFARYVELCKKHKLTMAAETIPADKYFAEIKNLEELRAVRIENDVWRLTMLPEQNGRIVEMLYKPAGRNVVAGFTHDDILRGSHQEIGLKGYDEEKPDAFTAKVKGNTIDLIKTLEDGTTVERRIALNARNPDRIWFQSTLTNRGPQPKVYQFKARPEFDPASKSDKCEVVSAYIKGPQWTRFNREWKADKGPDEATLKAAKAGKFAFYNHEARFGMLVTYDPAKVDHPYLWWFPEWPQINLELFTPAVELKPGKALTLSYDFEYLKEPPK